MSFAARSVAPRPPLWQTEAMSAAASAPAATIAAAARALVAEEGLRGLSLRKVAARAGVSVGGVNYQVGAKADLVRQLVAEAGAAQDELHRTWLARLRAADLADPAVLGTAVCGYLDDAAARREQALTICELVLEAGRDPQGLEEMRRLVEGEAAFWRELTGATPGGADLAAALAGYVRDELAFTLAIGCDPDYRLLRASVTGRLAERLAPRDGRGFEAGFETLVAAMDARAVDIRTLEGQSDSRRSQIAQAVAGLIAEAGVAALTHRAVAAAAGVPNSTVAHHFRTRQDLLRAGIEALYLGAVGSATPQADETARRGGQALMQGTSILVLAAARDAALRPFALDLRRRRGEYMRAMTAAIDAAGPLEPAAHQAAAMAITGAGLARQATEQTPGADATIAALGRLRRAR